MKLQQLTRLACLNLTLFAFISPSPAEAQTPWKRSPHVSKKPDTTRETVKTGFLRNLFFRKKIISAHPTGHRNRELAPNTLSAPYEFVDRTSRDFYLWRYLDAKENSDEQMAIRNEILFYWITLADEFYFDQQNSRREVLAVVGAAKDLTTLASSLATNMGTIQILNDVSANLGSDRALAIATAKQGGYSGVVSAGARYRAEILDNIRKKTATSTKDYSLITAEKDIIKYWSAGTSIESILFAQREAAKEAKASAAKLEKAKKNAKESQESVQNLPDSSSGTGKPTQDSSEANSDQGSTVDGAGIPDF